MALFTYKVALLLLSHASRGDEYKISFLYPETDAFELSLYHYAGAFQMAIEHVNNVSVTNKLNITFTYVLDDINKGNQYLSGFDVKELESLRIIASRSTDKYDAFVGPGLETCSYPSRLAAAYDKPIIAYVSLDNL